MAVANNKQGTSSFMVGVTDAGKLVVFVVSAAALLMIAETGDIGRRLALVIAFMALFYTLMSTTGSNALDWIVKKL